MAGPETDLFIGIAQQALWVTALVAAPLLIAALAIGLLIGIVQAATSINEQTLSFVPKLVVCGVVLALLGGAMMTLIGDFTRDLFALIPELLA
jgi:flagellar biosynthesis protein FliQ